MIIRCPIPISIQKQMSMSTSIPNPISIPIPRQFQFICQSQRQRKCQCQLNVNVNVKVNPNAYPLQDAADKGDPPLHERGLKPFDLLLPQGLFLLGRQGDVLLRLRWLLGGLLHFCPAKYIHKQHHAGKHTQNQEKHNRSVNMDGKQKKGDFFLIPFPFPYSSFSILSLVRAESRLLLAESKLPKEDLLLSRRGSEGRSFMSCVGVCYFFFFFSF